MAQPRVFISSTCYDLQEVRFQLRQFIEDFGFIPVMSEFGDIFYDYRKHVQDSCKDEISKCHLFVLIIGSNYGTNYYNQKDEKLPDSITMQEFKKSLEVSISKHIFINKYVDYDYNNYNRLLKEHLDDYIKTVENRDTIDELITCERDRFSKEYKYPQKSYKYIFKFLDIIYDLKINNSKVTYESFQEIKDSLKKQWAGFMYNSILQKDKVSIIEVEKIGQKIDKLENQIKLLIDNRVTSKGDKEKITFDIKALAKEINIENVSEYKKNFESFLDVILYIHDDFGHPFERILLFERVDKSHISLWIDSLETIVKQYKWSNNISIKVIFDPLKVKYEVNYSDGIKYDDALNFSSFCYEVKQKFKEEDFENLLVTIADRMNSCYNETKEISAYESLLLSSQKDDLPF